MLALNAIEICHRNMKHKQGQYWLVSHLITQMQLEIHPQPCIANFGPKGWA